jgi:hypothetical protein
MLEQPLQQLILCNELQISYYANLFLIYTNVETSPNIHKDHKDNISSPQLAAESIQFSK